MMEMLPATRIPAPSEPRETIAASGSESPATRAGVLIPPIQAPEQSEGADLQPFPVPERSLPGARRDRDANLSEASGDATDDSLRVQRNPDHAAPAKVDPVSLFQGLVADAARADGSAVSGNAYRIYALVQQLSALVAPQMNLAA